MTIGKLHTSQLLLFTSSVILLSVLNLSNSSVVIQRPVILLAAAVFSLFNFERSNRLSVIAKIILLYIIEMLFNQLSGRFVHIGAFSISLPLIVMIPLTASFAFSKLRKSKGVSIETNELLKSWGVVFIVIVLHILFLFLLLKKTYGYGYDHNFAVLANICLYFLVFIFTWQQLDNIYLRRITVIVLTAFFVVSMVMG